MAIYFKGPEQAYCTHCDFSFYSLPPIFEHSLHTEHWVGEGYLKERMRTCPHAGKKFKFPEFVQLMDEETDEQA